MFAYKSFTKFMLRGVTFPTTTIVVAVALRRHVPSRYHVAVALALTILSSLFAPDEHVGMWCGY